MLGVVFEFLIIVLWALREVWEVFFHNDDNSLTLFEEPFNNNNSVVYIMENVHRYWDRFKLDSTNLESEHTICLFSIVMSLVNYSSSDDHESCSEDAEYNSTDKRSTESSPPSKKPKVEDDTAETIQMGRVRSFAHVRGNWATFIYIPYRLNDSIHDLQRQIANNFLNDFNTKIHFIDSLHISLSRTVVLQHHWIEAFTKSIKDCVGGLKRFHLNLNTINVYCNDDCTTTFIAIAVPEMDCNPLRTLVEKFNNCLSEYRLPFFYKDASFHVSILWCSGNQKAKILMEIETLQQFLDESILDDYEDYQIVVNQIECKVGNKVYTYPLS